VPKKELVCKKGTEKTARITNFSQGEEDMGQNIFMKALLFMVVILLTANIAVQFVRIPTPLGASSKCQFFVASLNIKNNTTFGEIEGKFNALGSQGWDYAGDIAILGTSIPIFKKCG